MAGRGLIFQTPEGTAVAVTDTRKTVAQVQAPANFRVRVKRVVVTFDGQSATDAKIYGAIRFQTAKTDDSTAMTAQLQNPLLGAAQTTGRHTYTSEPSNTAAGIQHECLVHPQGGISWVPSGPTFIENGGALGVECEVSASATHYATVTIEVEE